MTHHVFWYIIIVLKKKGVLFTMDLNIRKPELLAPAGNYEKMKAAYLYGADAVYIGGKLFGKLDLNRFQ